MTEKISTEQDIQKVMKAFRIKYEKFQKDYKELGDKFATIATDAFLILSASQEIIDYASNKKGEGK